MELIFLIKGIIIGFCVAAPVGPIGILCIRRTLQFGRLSGFFSGLGAACADMTYGAIAAFGVTLISDFLLMHKMWFHFFGGFLLLLLGAHICLSKPPKDVKSVSHKTLLSDFVSTFILTLANPLTVIAFVAIFAGMGLSDTPAHAPAVVLGVFLGAAGWWLLLSEGVTFFRHKISQNLMLWINRVAGGLIFTLGIIALTFTWCVHCRI